MLTKDAIGKLVNRYQGSFEKMPSYERIRFIGSGCHG